MNFLVVVVIGAVLGAFDGVGIFFEPKEPYKWQILFVGFDMRYRSERSSARVMLGIPTCY